VDKNAGARGNARRCMVTKADQEDVLLDLWSALQTHLQGVDRATLAIMLKDCRHRAALLSQLRDVKITRPTTASKSKPPPSQAYSETPGHAFGLNRDMPCRPRVVADRPTGALLCEEQENIGATVPVSGTAEVCAVR
jgi:hypothetical protein